MAAKDGSGDMDTAEVPLDFEEDLAEACSSSPDSKFDIIIGHIEEIIMEDEFQQLQQDFMDKYYHEFEDTEENKFSYTEIHKEYIDLIEKFLLTALAERVDDFDVNEFQRELVKRKEELNGEVFEMLLTFSDFLAFKEMFIDYRNEKEGRGIDLSGGFVVHSLTSSAAPSSSKQATTTIAPAVTSQQSVHSLDLGGQSVLICAPGSQVDIDFSPSAVQLNRVGPVLTNGLSSGVTNGEEMNISPRPEQMDQ